MVQGFGASGFRDLDLGFRAWGFECRDVGLTGEYSGIRLKILKG